MKDFAVRLLNWHHQFGRRGLPWQGQRDPYRVWLSEIMLQQTQVATVIERYQQFLKVFPDIHSLANAPLEEVMALWAGLGYYFKSKKFTCLCNKNSLRVWW
jgi:A/G-specific adenine glycosylase